jgi:hypothetical protein
MINRRYRGLPRDCARLVHPKQEHPMTPERKCRCLPFSTRGLFWWTTILGLLFAILATDGPWPLLPGGALLVLVLAMLWTSPNP